MTEEYNASDIDLSDIINSLPGHVYWIDKNGIMRGCNEQQAKYLGLTVQEAVGKSLYELARKEYIEALLATNKEVLSTGKTITREEGGRSVDGEELIFLSKKVPFKNRRGEVVGILGISFDITEYKKAAKQKTGLIHDIIELMPGHVYWKDKDCRFLGCNEQQAISAGFASSEEMIGKSDYEMPWKEQAAELNLIDKEIMRTKEPKTLEELSRLPDGSLATFLTKKVALLNDQGQVTGVLGVSFDITDKKNSERLEKEKLVVEESLKNAKLMAAGIAHELRTPLATINSMAGNLEHYMADVFKGYEMAVAEKKMEKLDDEILQYLKSAPQALSKVTYGANTFINMMLMKVNLENVKRHELNKLSMADCVDESIKLYPIEDEDKKLIKANLEKDFDFMGDKSLFVHIIFNLLKNALYYIKAVRKGEITIWLEPGEELNVLHFKDTGKGMAPEVLANLFGAFYSKTRHGTGVGLALCKLIMQEFRGSIACDSVEGEYTHFKMMFPKIQQD